MAGEPAWSDYELSFLVTPISGGNAQAAFRLSEDGRNFYLLDSCWDGRRLPSAGVVDGRVTKLSVVNHPLHAGQEYEVQIAARGESPYLVRRWKLVNQVTDATFRTGPFGFMVWESSTALPGREGTVFCTKELGEAPGRIGQAEVGLRPGVSRAGIGTNYQYKKAARVVGWSGNPPPLLPAPASDTMRTARYPGQP